MPVINRRAQQHHLVYSGGSEEQEIIDDGLAMGPVGGCPPADRQMVGNLGFVPGEN